MVVTRIRRGYLVGFLLLLTVVLVSVAVRFLVHDRGPTVTIVSPEGRTETISLAELKRMPTIRRNGVYQNQYGNWRDEGVYVGVRLVDLIGGDADYASIQVVAEDGYAATIERERVEDNAFPMVLSYAFEGREAPGWPDGYRIAVLPEHGSVGNEEYGVVSAGSYWVKNVDRIILQATPSSSSVY